MQRREAGTLGRRRYFLSKPRPVVFLTAADTDIQTLAAAVQITRWVSRLAGCQPLAVAATAKLILTLKEFWSKPR